jgi:ADP-ribose pyrophosphatase YjhB (NUDIX family)
LAQRGEKAKNERGTWEFPGGGVEYGERLTDAVRREFEEEYGMVIEVGALLAVDDHILEEEGQHWISPTFLARHIGGTPQIKEASKCSAIGWFPLDALPEPLSKITQANIRDYITTYGTQPPPF